jgi:predicted MFS family arabinose efflux permease
LRGLVVAERSGGLLGYALLTGLAAAVGQGFARFGYALLLPPMRAELRWSYAQAGILNSANALGYLAGALGVGYAVARWGAARVIRISLLVVALSLIVSGVSANYWLLLLARVLAGIGTGLIFVSGAAVVIALAQRRAAHPDLAVGVYFAGPGLGIALSGLIVPLLLGAFAWRWPTVWIALGVLGLLVIPLVELPLRQLPPHTRQTAVRALFVWDDYRALWPGLTAYGLYGLGYIGYMTFAIAYLRSIDVAAGVVQVFWVLLGLSAALTGFLWRRPIASLSTRRVLLAILLLLAVGAALPVLWPTLPGFLGSAALFGGSFLAVVTVITKQARVTVPPERVATVVGNATAVFALGQLIGPTLVGALADLPGGLPLGLLASAGVLVVAAVVGQVRSASAIAASGQIPGDAPRAP